MDEQDGHYRRALRFRFLTRFYDPMFRWGLREERIKGDLVKQAAPIQDERVLDLGCGTGTLLLKIRSSSPEVQLVGLDADPDILKQAFRKASQVGKAICFDRGLASELPYADGSFDHVFSSLMLHHLTGSERRQALREIVRVLRPGGYFHLVDWDRPANPLLWLSFQFVRILDGYERTRDSARGELSARLREAGFSEIEHLGRYATAGGTLSRYRARTQAGGGRVEQSTT